jgi:hypothetical protein
METIRSTIASSFTSTKDSSDASSSNATAKKEVASADDANIFTNFLGYSKKTPEQSAEGGPPSKKEEPSSSDHAVVEKPEGEPLANDPKKEEPSSSDHAVVENPEGEPLKEMDTSDTDKLQRNEDKLLFKIEILEKMNKIKLDELPYVKREKIVNEIVNNNKYKHTTNKTNEEENGVVYENDKHEILVIGNLSLDDKKALMLGIENTDVYNNLL